MSTTPTPPMEKAPAGAAGEVAGDALVPSPHGAQPGASIFTNSLAMRLPVELEVAIPLRDFRVRNLLALHTGTLIESQWVHGEDVPIGSVDVQLAWSEFEVVDTQLAVRLTRLL